MLRRDGVSEERIEPRLSETFQVGPALLAGFIAGAVLLVVPRGSPWSTFTFFAPMVMGRMVPDSFGLGLPTVWAIHLGLSLVYGLVISAVIMKLHQERAVLAGAIVGLVLSILNLLLVPVLWRNWQSSYFAVIFTHIVFGLICAGAYRGLLRRRVLAD
jgi:hypothetical protein